MTLYSRWLRTKAVWFYISLVALALGWSLVVGYVFGLREEPPPEYSSYDCSEAPCVLKKTHLYILKEGQP